jgi:ketosteroid isomerase-like protein
MKRGLLAAVVILSAVSFACTTASPLSDQDKAAIQKLHDDYARAWNVEKPDVPAMVKVSYNDESRVFAPNVPVVQGPEAIAEVLSSGPAARNFKFSGIEIDGRADIAYAHGAYEGDWATPSGVMVHDKGKFVTVTKKQADGSWKIVHDIWNSDTAQPALPVATGTMAADASPDVKNLGYFVGRWQVGVDGQQWPLGPAGKQSILLDCRWFADGRQVVCSNEGTTPAGPYHELWIAGPDPDTKAYKGYDLDNTGLATNYVMTFKDNVWVIEYPTVNAGGKRLKIKTTFFDLTQDEFSMKTEYSTGGAAGVVAEAKGRRIVR